MVVKGYGGSTLDEEGNEDLNAVDKLLYRRIGQRARKHFKFPTSACIAFEKLPGRFPISRVLLDVRVEFGGVLEGDFRNGQPDIQSAG